MDLFVQLTINGVIAGAIYALIALGFALIFGVTKFFNLAHGAVAVVGGYAAFFFLEHAGLGVLPAAALAVCVAGMVGFALHKTVFLPLRRRQATNLVLLIAALGLLTVIQALIAMFFGSQFHPLSQFAGAQEVYRIAGGAITLVQLIIIISALAVFGLLTLFLKKTKFGKAVKAIGDDEEVAQIVGINTHAIIGYVFFIGSAIAGLGGVLVGFDTGIEPTMGLSLLLKGIIAAIVGGVGSLSGAVLGAFLLGLAENLGIWHISGEWKDAIAFGILIFFLIWRPRGILPR
ncbi:MAG: branched-chain amino acid ABC transporter permease [Parcubacteria group bacterium]|nr:branched-chain amino acid ABC transporter permease [Parcubacteria group bacterium]